MLLVLAHNPLVDWREIWVLSHTTPNYCNFILALLENSIVPESFVVVDLTICTFVMHFYWASLGHHLLVTGILQSIMKCDEPDFTFYLFCFLQKKFRERSWARISLRGKQYNHALRTSVSPLLSCTLFLEGCFFVFTPFFTWRNDQPHNKHLIHTFS